MKEFDKLIKIIKVLRAPGGCPWDRAQKISYYKKYLLEEVYELIEAIHKKDRIGVKEEIGDVFLILAVIAQMYAEKKVFSIEEVIREINYKLISRHPHVFGNKKLKNKEEVLAHWIKHKARKKKRKTVKDRLPMNAPALLLADILFKEVDRKAHKNKKQEIEKALKEIRTSLSSFNKTTNKADLLAQAILNLCKLSFLYHMDLESILRMKVITQASKIEY